MFFQASSEWSGSWPARPPASAGARDATVSTSTAHAYTAKMRSRFAHEVVCLRLQQLGAAIAATSSLTTRPETAYPARGAARQRAFTTLPSRKRSRRGAALASSTSDPAGRSRSRREPAALSQVTGHLTAWRRRACSTERTTGVTSTSKMRRQAKSCTTQIIRSASTRGTVPTRNAGRNSGVRAHGGSSPLSTPRIGRPALVPDGQAQRQVGSLRP